MIQECRSVRAGTPAAEDDCEIGSADNSVVVDVAVKLALSIRAPSAEECGEVDAIDCVVARDIAGAWSDFATVGDAVGIRISELAAEDLPVIHDAVGVAVGGPFDDVGRRLVLLVDVVLVLPLTLWPRPIHDNGEGNLVRISWMPIRI